MLKRHQFLLVLATACVLSACSLGRTALPDNAYLESLGIRARQASDLAAISELQRWSQQHLVTAQRELGLSLARTEDKYPDAVFWLLEAARQGDAEAQFQIAEAYFHARLGLQKQSAQAYRWYQAAAAQNDHKAALMLARMAKYGDGTVASTVTSLKWLQRAAELGNAQAMFLLSNAYEHGEGVNADPALAREWLEKAADGEYPPAVHQLALLLETDQKPEERERARLLRKEATDERHLRWKNYQ